MKKEISNGAKKAAGEGHGKNLQSLSGGRWMELRGFRAGDWAGDVG